LLIGCGQNGVILLKKYKSKLTTFIKANKYHGEDHDFVGG
jgi:hypothetical protein